MADKQAIKDPARTNNTQTAGRESKISDYIISTLAAHGVKQVYGYPGAAITSLMAAVDRHPDVSWILMRNEASASLAASAHAKLTGRLAVCMATSGPGATNLVTGLVDAQVDSVPVLAITGSLQTWRQGRLEFQDIDQSRLLSDILPYSVQCNHPDQLPAILRDCIGRAEQEKCVVHLAIAYDVQTYEPSAGDPRYVVDHRPEPLLAQLPPPQTLDGIASALDKHNQVVIAVGPRARGSGAGIEKLADKLSAPVIVSFNAKGVIDETHRCFLGVLGIFGAPGVEASQKVISAADAILSFGLSDLSQFVAGQDGVQTKALYQCEPDFSSITHRFHRDGTLIGPLDQIVREIERRLPGKRDSQLLLEAVGLKQEFEDVWSKLPEDKGTPYVHPVHLLMALPEFLDESSVVTLDIGDNAVWAAQFLKLTGRQPVLVSENLGVMGFCLPAAIAARLASPQAKVVGITGDGGLQMTIGELATATQYGLDFVLIVINNGILARIQAVQKQPFGTFIHNPDFVALARAYGGDGVTIDGNTDIKAALRKAFAHKGSPFILDVRCDPKVLAPMSKWEDGFTPVHFS